MRIDQLMLQLEDKSELVRVWTVLPPDSRMSVARVYARLLIRAAKVVTPVLEEKGRIDHACRRERTN